METQLIQEKIYILRAQKVIFDFDLARLYGVETRALKQAVKRNLDRFPPDFMVELSKEEWNEVITKCDNLPDNVKFSPSPPFAFTEQGVAMLSSVLKSKKAVQVNIAVMRAFVLLRQHLTNYQDLKIKIELLEKEMNIKFKDINQAIAYLITKDKMPDEQSGRKRIGFKRQ